MQQITTKLPEDTIESLDHVATEQYGGNRSEAIRALITEALTMDERASEYEQQIEDRENENERLRRQLAAVNSRQEDVTELVEYVTDELSYREAGLRTRMRWWLFGKGDE